jgi:hypothetical protein
MRVRKILIVYTCINRDCRQINCPSIADLFCDYFNPLSHRGPVELYMFIVVKFYNRYSTINSVIDIVRTGTTVMHASCFAVQWLISAAWYDITPFPTLLDKFTNEEQNLFIVGP